MEKVAEFYKKIASNFDTMLDRPKIKEIRDYESERFLQHLDLSQHQKVLSVGIGTANDEKRMDLEKTIDSSISWIGVDLTLEMLQKARLYDRVNGFVCANINETPFNNETFNRILFHHVLCHIKDYEKTLDTMYDLLKPEGLLVFSELISPNETQSKIIFNKNYPKYRERKIRETNSSLEVYRSGKAYRGALLNSGFKITKIEEITKDCLLFVAKKE